MEYFTLLWTPSISVLQTVSGTLHCWCFYFHIFCLCLKGMKLWKECGKTTFPLCFISIAMDLIIDYMKMSLKPHVNVYWNWGVFEIFPVVFPAEANLDALVSLSDYHLLIQWCFDWKERRIPYFIIFHVCPFKPYSDLLEQTCCLFLCVSHMEHGNAYKKQYILLTSHPNKTLQQLSTVREREKQYCELPDIPHAEILC